MMETGSRFTHILEKCSRKFISSPPTLPYLAALTIRFETTEPRISKTVAPEGEEEEQEQDE